VPATGAEVAGDVREPVPVVGTLAGKAYSSTTIHESGDTGDDRRRLWLRLLEPEVGREALEPGDMILLHSDGLSEASVEDGRRLGIDGLRAFIEREAAAQNTAPETLRRLRHAIVGSGEDRLKDDATALLVEWRRGSEQRLLPPGV